MVGDFMNIVYGGSFNPPTLAHLKIVETLWQHFPEAHMIILPVGNDYRKPELAPFMHRKEMLKLLFKDYLDKITISSLEADVGFKGTVYALDKLKESYDNLSFVVGYDHLQQLDTWIEAKRLLATYPLILIDRNLKLNRALIEEKFKVFDHQFYYLEFDMDVSASKIRENSEQYRHFTTDPVYRYLKKYRLYEE